MSEMVAVPEDELQLLLDFARSNLRADGPQPDEYHREIEENVERVKDALDDPDTVAVDRDTLEKFVWNWDLFTDDLIDDGYGPVSREVDQDCIREVDEYRDSVVVDAGIEDTAGVVDWGDDDG